MAGAMAGQMEAAFTPRDCRVIGLIVDPVDDHIRWQRDIADVTGQTVGFPLIGDSDLTVSKLFGMLPAAEAGSAQDRGAADNAAVRTVFIIGPDKKVKLMTSYPMTTGRNFDGVLRVLDSVQLTEEHSVATPGSWTQGAQGDEVFISPAISDETARSAFPAGWRFINAYMPLTGQPRAAKS